MKIRNRILVTILSVVILIVGLDSVIIFFFAQKYLSTASQNLLTTTSRSKSENISTLINEQKQNVIDIATASIFRDYYVDTTNIVNKDKVQQRLERTIKGNPAIREIYILDVSGVVLLSTDEEDFGKNIMADDNIAEAKNGPSVGNVRLYGDDKKTIYTISAPIFNSSSILAGIFVVRFNTNFINTIVSSGSETTKSEDVFLVDKNYYFLTPTRYYNQDAVLSKKAETLNVQRCFSQDEIIYVSERLTGQRYVNEHRGHPAITLAHFGYT